MAETAKITANPKKAEALPDLSAEVSDNGPSREEALFFLGQWLKHQDEIKLAQRAFKRLKNEMKVRGFAIKPFVDVVRVRESQNSDPMLAELKAFKRYAEFFELDIGTQLAFFDEGAREGFSEEGLLKKAYNAGLELGLMGKNPDEQAYPPMTTEGGQHRSGWDDGQKILKERLAKYNADMRAAEKAERKKDEERAAKKAAKAEEAGSAGEDGADTVKPDPDAEAFSDTKH